jgi:CubicO group peptidase (beta-lactamase class C family)
MPDQTRSLPDQPSLRYLKIEAKRRLAAGEFPTLHEAQAAIAAEHGFRNWAALKQAVGDQAEGHALAQVRWLIGRFAGAGTPGWTVPAEPELAEHFSADFLAQVPPSELTGTLGHAAPLLHEDLVVLDSGPLTVTARLADKQVKARVAGDPPHRFTALQISLAGRPVTDPRVSALPPARTAGPVPEQVAGIAGEAMAELGLPGLVIAGGGPHEPAWVIANGWADLDRNATLGTDGRFPAQGLAPLVTATAVLRLAADGRVSLDAPANDYLRGVRLDDDTVTVRELLSHAGGVRNPDPGELFGDQARDLVTITGPVLACDGARGVLRPSNGGYAVLGQLIADVTGMEYVRAASRLVLEPLGLGASLFTTRVDSLGPDTVTCYEVSQDGAFQPLPAKVCTIPAISGLWVTGAEMARLATGWRSLLPAGLAGEAFRPQAELTPGGPQAGLGWLLTPDGEFGMHAGAAYGATAVVLGRIDGGQVYAIMANRMTALGLITDRLRRGPAEGARS